MSDNNNGGGARRGERGNHQRDNRNDRNGNDRNGGGNKKQTAKFTNKIDGLLDLKLPEEGGEATQFDRFLHSFEVYAKTNVGKSGSLTRRWAREYITARKSDWTPAEPPPVDKSKFTDTDVDATKLNVANKKYDAQLEAYAKCLAEFWDGIKEELFGIVESNMSISFASKIHSVPKWDQMSEDSDLPALLKECEILAGGSSSHQFGALTTIQAYKQFFNCRQKYNQTIF